MVDDDAALYLEYQNLQSQHDEAVYDMADESSENAQVVLSFEEWKRNRKQFKQGTRGSFVRYPLTHLLTHSLTHLLKKSISNI